MRQTLRQGALGVAGLLALFALWWLGVALFGAADGLSARFSPQATLLSLGELLERRELYEHVLVSLKRVLLGLFLALLVGVLRPATAVAGGQPRRRRLPQRLGALGPPRLRPFAGTDPPAHRQPARRSLIRMRRFFYAAASPAWNRTCLIAL